MRTRNFDQIYQLAKNGTIEELKTFLSGGIKIDTRKKDCLFSPAGQLASEGNRDAAERLRNLQANVDFIAFGAAYGGYREYAEFLVTTCQADKDEVFAGAAAGLQIDYLNKLEEDENGYPIDPVAEGFVISGQFSNQTIALKTLTTMPDYYFSPHEQSIIKSHTSVDINLLQPHSWEMKVQMKEGLNYNQSLAWTSLSFPFLMLGFLPYIVQHKLPIELALHLFTFLQPMTLIETEDLFKRKTFSFCKKNITQDLIAYKRLSNMLFFQNDRDKPDALLSQINASKTLDDLKKIIEQKPGDYVLREDKSKKRKRVDPETELHNDFLQKIIVKYNNKINF